MLSPLCETFDVIVPAKGAHGRSIPLPGSLTVPATPTGMVILARGSESSLPSDRHAAVAGVLNDFWISTLVFDLLTDGESAHHATTVDIPLLAERLLVAIRFAQRREELRYLSIGLFGAGTDAAAALAVAACEPTVKAVVSSGGRLDLAGRKLRSVHAPTLLIVGGDDLDGLAVNRHFLAEIGCEDRQLDVIPGASNLFEEPGTLAESARRASDWFTRHLHDDAGT